MQVENRQVQESASQFLDVGRQIIAEHTMTTLSVVHQSPSITRLLLAVRTLACLRQLLRPAGPIAIKHTVLVVGGGPAGEMCEKRIAPKILVRAQD